MKLGEAMYKAASDAAGDEAEAPAEGDAGGEDVVDADFEEVDDDDQKKSA